MEVIAAATIWGLFAAFLIFPLAGVPRLLQRAAATLLAAEFIAVGIWAFGSEGCRDRPCGAVAELGYTAAELDIPLLGLALLVLAVVFGVREQRRRRRADAAAAVAVPRARDAVGRSRRSSPWPP